MYSYRIYGLCVHSDLEFPGFPEGGGSADVTVRLRKLDDAELERESSWGGRVWGRILHDLQFLVEGGHTIVVDNRSGVPDEDVGGYVIGVLMATLLRQRGLLVLHACCVARDGWAIGFVGESGWGKSTLAEFFCQQGYELINDDVLAIRLEPGEEPVVIPGPPQIKLRPASGAWLRADFEQLPQLYARADKRSSTLHAYRTDPVPLRKLFLLESRYADYNAVEPLARAESVLALISQTRATNLISDRPHTALHLQQCGQLAGTVPISRLQRIRSLDELPNLMALIEQDLGVPAGDRCAV